MNGKRALVVGATGLVGSELIKILLASSEYDTVTAWVRKPTGISNQKLEEKIIDFDMLENCHIDGHADDVFCCLGTTIKKAKTRKAFQKVDLEYPLVLGRWAKKKGVSQFLVISAMGADPKSMIFYNKTKGQLEQGLKEIGLKGLHIFRPSLLLGKRNEFRFWESTFTVILRLVPFIFAGPLKKYRPIQGRDVADAMYRKAVRGKKGTHVYLSNEI